MRFSRPRRGRGIVGRLPLTSLIDVVFLLIIYFLVTAHYAQPESDLSAALQSNRQSGGRAADLQPQVVHVALAEDGRVTFRIGERLVHDKAALAAVLRELPKEGGAFLRVGAEAPVWGAAAAWQACRDAGFEKVSYVGSR
ncbi:MAG TPA: biopolymer transporter ExbD [Solirubrobacterales bacterium]|nr:biopolymer transporter ExbD [Solirubrobacterales bacterium]